MGISYCTVNLSANISPLPNTACAGSDLFRLGFLKITHFVVQESINFTVFVQFFEIALKTIIIC